MRVEKLDSIYAENQSLTDWSRRLEEWELSQVSISKRMIEWFNGNDLIGVYFLQAKSTRLIKIGRSISMRKRVDDLRTLNADELVLVAWIAVGVDHRPWDRVTRGDREVHNPRGAAVRNEQVAVNLETVLHRLFKDDRVHGEWFRSSMRLDRVMRLSIQASTCCRVRPRFWLGDEATDPLSRELMV